MGRIGDTVTTCWRTADKMKKLTGSLDGDPPSNDNQRILRYLAKLTINPALHPRHRPSGRLARARQGRRHRPVADEHLRSQAEVRHQGRVRQLGADGRPERVDPDAGTGAAAADVRRPRASGRAHLDHVRVAGRRRRRDVPSGSGWTAGSSRSATAARSARRRWCATTRRRRSPSTRRPTRSRSTDGRRPSTAADEVADVPALLHRLMAGHATPRRGVALVGFLSVLQLSDSAFPSGRYTLSHGLEALAQSGLLATPTAPARCSPARRLHPASASAPSDGVALACAHRAAARHGTVDLDLVDASRPATDRGQAGREARDASTRTGRALLGIAHDRRSAAAALVDYAELVGADALPATTPSSSACSAPRSGVPRLEAVAGELYAFVGRLGRGRGAARPVIDHRTAQRLLHRVRPVTGRGRRRRRRPGRRRHLELHAAAGRDVDAARGGRAPACSRAERKEIDQ